MGLWDILTKTNAERQADKLRQQQMLMGIPDQFNIEASQIPGYAEQVARGYADMGNIPLSMFQKPQPEGWSGPDQMGLPHNVPENLPVEYVQPRTAQDMAMREGGIEGAQLGQKKIAEYQQYKGMFDDADMDIEGSPIPGIDPATSAGLQRYAGADSQDKKYELITTVDESGQQIQKFVEVGSQGQWPAVPKGDDKEDVMVDPDGPEGPLPKMSSKDAYHYMQKPGSEKDKYAPIFDDALQTVKYYLSLMKIPEDIKTMAALDRTGSFLKNPRIIAAITPNVPPEFKVAFEKAVGQVLWILDQREKEMPGMSDPDNLFDENKGLLFK